MLAVRRALPHAARRHVLWAVPLSAGAALYALNRPQPPSVLASPAVIPLRPSIFSPSEAHRSLSAALRALLRDRIWEPVLTARRFLYLLFLFAPVILTSPMLLIGKPDKALNGDRWGAVWWYGLLVSRMEAAGPTFVKVRNCITSFSPYSPHPALAMGCLARRSVPRSSLRELGLAPLPWNAPPLLSHPCRHRARLPAILR